MHYEDVEIFLSICECKGISSAAKKLYLAQSTVSAHLQRLEQDLGCVLIVRNPGTKKFMLTLRGEEFLKLAQKFSSIWNDITHFPDNGFRAMQSISVGSTASVYEIILPPFFKMLYEDRENFQLTAFVGVSSKLLEMIETGKLDYAFSSIPLDSQSIKSIPVFREKYVLICSKALLPDGDTEVEKLHGYNELFYSWAVGFKLRHSMLRPVESSPYLLCDTPFMYMEMARKIEFWSICPVSVLGFLKAGGVEFDVHGLAQPLPDRVIYLLSSPQLREEASRHAFERAFACFYQSLPDCIAIRD